ncbi:FMRFamide receptor [Metopolophium dirhodum]|uniref:FMRFamide receptor n=1 Tax=Metopolophium dirhodum TaxID=44670 RepID=UPI0029902843|nr:FMRFamide receptor [Metopolophium dirhodum]XP_060878621.1 FMRFamide receptor [Metopolophium dirhodum]XP_060878622.1 FMRFamide receptor [Metopolophium dirhodum]XP_060878623.1 FMRFamide receptor [Metopolophium dirhodum]XP_060878624.1 FMRFamide receptor [Metopolophium dirhodum]XP_060878625.1 FMRFamide receptor [Metopolophium dirhodum]
MSTDINEDFEDEISLTDRFVKYYPLAVVCLGSLGNCISVLVFFGTKLRKQSSSYYLSSLAISDTLFLLIQLMPVLSKVGIGIYHMQGFCQFFVYLAQICSFISVWLVVVFTSERFIAVRYPLHRSVICTVYRAKIVLSILITFALIVHIPYLVISGPNDRVLANNSTTTECSLNFSWYELYTWLNYADVLMNMMIPFFLIVIFNSMICQSVCRLARIRRTMTLHPSRRRQSTSQNSQHTSQIKVTEMLLVVSTVFLCLNLPSYVFRVWMVWDTITSAKYKTIQVIANQMYNTHFGINFVLYCVSGQNFRRALVELWNKRRHSNKRLKETQVTTVLSEFSKSGVGSKQTTVNGTWKEVHELIPIAHS